MSYNIRKGWPCHGALDENLMPANTDAFKEGIIVALNADGKVEVADAVAADGPMCGFNIGVEKVTGAVTTLLNDCIIDMDAEHYVAGTYNPNDALSASAGKFGPAGSNKVLARVISFKNGILRVKWFSAN